MVNRRRTLPPVSPRLDREIKPLISAISEILEVGEGVRGDPLDRKITYRDLLDSGIGQLRPGLRPNNPGALKPGEGPKDMRIPPKPSGFAVSGGFNGLISLAWDIPGELYSNHAHTNIYRAEEDNFANAELVGRDAGAFYTDVVRADAEIKTYYYWIAFVSTSNIEGPTNATSGTPGQALEDTGYLIEKLSGEIRESELAQDLNSRIDLIDGPEDLMGSVAARMKTERTERADADTALSQQIDTVIAQANGNQAAIQTEQTARADADTALSQQIDTVQSTVGDNTTSLQTQAESIDGVKAQYTVKIDANGAVAGFGLASTPSDDTEDGNFSEFYINADRFAVMPQGANKAEAVAPFIVQDGEVFINVARIKKGSIQKGQIGAIGFGQIEDANGLPVTTVAGKLKAQNIDVDNLSVAEAAKFYGDNQSGNFLSGDRGWKLWQDGRMEISQGQINDSVVVGSGGKSVSDLNEQISAVDNWVKPNTTLIDGNKIFTGDAYVDTLQIKGQAVTFARGAYTAGKVETNSTSWKTIQSIFVPRTGAPIIFWYDFEYDLTNFDGSFKFYMRIVDDSGKELVPARLIDLSSISDGGYYYWVADRCAGTAYSGNPGAGAASIQLQMRPTRKPTNEYNYAEYISFVLLEAKR